MYKNIFSSDKFDYSISQLCFIKLIVVVKRNLKLNKTKE